MIMSKIIITAVLLLAFTPTIGQVGINTTNPQEMLDVNGKIRVTDTNVDFGRTMVSIIGVDDEDTLSKINISSDFVITENTLTVSGTTSYSVINIDFEDAEDDYLDDYVPGVDIANLDLGLDNLNAQETVIRFTNPPEAFYISGIAGGVAGRHILLLNPTENIHIGVRDETYSPNLSAIENRILTYGSGFTDATSGQGAIELVYDGTRWIVLNKRN
jgi:hypothetical protein